MTIRQNIPKIIHQIWLGPEPRPVEWMETWKQKHPDWAYKLWTEENLPPMQNRKQFDAINTYNGKSDILRMEVLYLYGGIYVDADSECLLPLDPLLRYYFFTAYENEIVSPGRISPATIGASPRHPLILKILEAQGAVEDTNIVPAWIVVGNVLFTSVIRKYEALYGSVKILPSYAFLPTHYKGTKYKGRGKVYATHHWYTTYKLLGKP